MNYYNITIHNKSEINLLINKLIPYITVPYCFCLVGSLGTGKTFFSQCLIKKLCGNHTNVKSPTFSLVNIYNTVIKKKPVKIWHFDLYRLNYEEEALELGLNEALNHDIVIIEWANKLKTLYPQNATTINFTLNTDNTRSLNITNKKLNLPNIT